MKSVLFTIFGFPVHSYGLMMVTGFMLGARRASKAAKGRNIPPEKVWDIALLALVCGIIGSRIVYVLLNYQTESWKDIYKVWQGGLSFHGGIIFGLLGVLIYCNQHKLNFWKLADLFAPSIALAYAFTRIGCFLNGCCYGAPTSLPWAVRFQENGHLTAPSHPAQLYASAANLLIFVLLVRVEKLALPAGAVFSAYITLYGIYRFLIEFVRAGYSAQISLWGLTQAQWVSLVMIVAGGIYYWKCASNSVKAVHK